MSKVRSLYGWEKAYYRFRVTAVVVQLLRLYVSDKDFFLFTWVMYLTGVLKSIWNYMEAWVR